MYIQRIEGETIMTEKTDDYLELNTNDLETMDQHHVVHMIQRMSNTNLTLKKIFEDLDLSEEEKGFLFRVIQAFYKRMNEYSKQIVDETMGRDVDNDNITELSDL